MLMLHSTGLPADGAVALQRLQLRGERSSAIVKDRRLGVAMISPGGLHHPSHSVCHHQVDAHHLRGKQGLHLVAWAKPCTIASACWAAAGSSEPLRLVALSNCMNSAVLTRSSAVPNTPNSRSLLVTGSPPNSTKLFPTSRIFMSGAVGLVFIRAIVVSIARLFASESFAISCFSASSPGSAFTGSRTAGRFLPGFAARFFFDLCIASVPLSVLNSHANPRLRCGWPQVISSMGGGNPSAAGGVVRPPTSH